MHLTIRQIRQFTVFSLLLLVLACSGPQTRPPFGDTTLDYPELGIAAELLELGDVLGAVGIYDQLAATAPRAAANELRLIAIEILFVNQFADLAASRLQQFKAKLSPALATRKRILEAHIALANQDGNLALRVLPALGADLPISDQARILEVQALAFEQLGRLKDAIQKRIKLELVLGDLTAIARNHNRIWQLLSQPNLKSLSQMQKRKYDDVYQGWVKLAIAARTALQKRTDLKSAIQNWESQHHGHPAASRFSVALYDKLLAQRVYPKQIALLLPLTGRVSGAATAVRDGFFTAFFQSQSDESKPEIKVYDIGKKPEQSRAVYDQAVDEGAGIVIGPLDKTAVAALADSGSLPVPVLSLNYTDLQNNDSQSNLYQFGLLPEDEATQIAEFALANGMRRAVALVPKDSWGERILKAFQTRYQELGGEVADHAFYSADKNDFSAPIEQLMGLQNSASRHRILGSTLRKRPLFEPRRRQDIDFIFVAATPKNARLIRPQLKFHRSGDIPTYATSHIYNGVPDYRANRDMDGYIYLDIPLILSDAAPIRETHKQMKKLWANSYRRLLRLYALGIDAYKLIPRLEQLHEDKFMVYNGLTGDISMTEDGRLHRRLRWATFKKGRAHALQASDIRAGGKK